MHRVVSGVFLRRGSRPIRSAPSAIRFGERRHVSLAQVSGFCQLRHLSASSACLAIKQFDLADIGEGIQEVVMKEWHVKVGDRVSEFDPICEVQSDKSNVTITSRYDGIITKLYHGLDDTATVGKALVDVETDDDSGSSGGQSDAVDRNNTDPSDPSPRDDRGESGDVSKDSKRPVILTTPAVRRLARENDVDLASVPGTGPHGRVLKTDILRHIAETEPGTRPSDDLVLPTPIAPPVAMPSPIPAPGALLAVKTAHAVDRVQKIVGFRKRMVQTMTAANAIPTFSFKDEISMNALVGVRNQLKPLADARGLKMSYMPFFIKAASMALSQYPVLNSSPNSECTTLTYKAQHNIGVAMDTPDGLVVPNIKSVETKSVYEIAAELQRLMSLGTAGKLSPADLEGGTFSLSNIGAIGGTYMRPVLLPPEVLIGAIGRMKAVPHFNEKEEVVKVQIVNISWSADHRVIDGATVARFSNLWKSYLEQPAIMLVDLR